MILPIGHEETTVRRIPWVTFGIMILCVVAFLLTGRGTGADAEAGAAGAQDLVRYFMAHPYLKLDGELAGRVFPGVGEERRATLLETLRAGARLPEDAATVRSEQEELERMAQDLEQAGAGPLLSRFGLVPAHPSWIAFLTHMFLHAGWLHLLGNLFILYLAGPYIEDVWGRPLFAALYLIGGAVASVAFVLSHPRLAVPLVGASGAIAGVMGAFLVRYARTRIRFFYFLAPGLRGTFEAPAWAMLPLWFLQQLFLAALQSTAERGGVAYLAHVVGFAFGVAAAWAVARFDVEARLLRPGIESKVTTAHLDKRALDEALSAKDAGNPGRAFELLSVEAARSPGDRDVAVAFWDVAVDLERAAEAAPALLRAIRQELRAGEAELACAHWIELRRHVDAVELDGPILVRLAQGLVERGEREEALRALRCAMEGAGSAKEPALGLRIARVAKDLDVAQARAAVCLALERHDLDPADRQQGERLLLSLGTSVH